MDPRSRRSSPASGIGFNSMRATRRIGVSWATPDDLVTTTRAWTDANANFIPDCALTDFAANGECAPINNANFGQSIISTRYAPGVVTGWGPRGFNWEVSPL